MSEDLIPYWKKVSSFNEPSLITSINSKLIYSPGDYVSSKPKDSFFDWKIPIFPLAEDLSA